MTFKKTFFLLTSFIIACSGSSSNSTESTDANLTEELTAGVSMLSDDILVADGAEAFLFDTLQAKEAKLVFRNDETGNLVYIHYSNDSTRVYEFDSGIDVYHPMISPDGKYVAFSTALEGIDRESRMYVQELSANPQSMVRLNDQGVIPRWRVHAMEDTVLIYVNNAGINVRDFLWSTMKTKKISFHQGKFKNPETLLEGAYHGGVTEDLRLALTGARYFRVHTTIGGVSKDTIWYESDQVCNVSLATDGSLRTLFLDLGADQGIQFSGTSYLAHHRILVMDSTGNLIQSIPSPDNYSFDHPEWIYGSNRYISFTLTSDYHEKIAVLDIQDSSVHVLASGNEIWHPDLWINR